MDAVQHQRPAQPPVVQQRLQLPVLRVVAPHEPDLRQPAAQPRLRLHHAQRARGIRHHRLLAQHRQPSREGGEQRLLVRLAGRGDQHGLHARRVQRGLDVRVHDDPVDRAHGRLRPLDVGVRHGGDPGSAHHPVEAPYVVGAHVSRAQDRHTQKFAHAPPAPSPSAAHPRGGYLYREQGFTVVKRGGAAGRGAGVSTAGRPRCPPPRRARRRGRSGRRRRSPGTARRSRPRCPHGRRGRRRAPGAGARRRRASSP